MDFLEVQERNANPYHHLLWRNGVVLPQFY